MLYNILLLKKFENSKIPQKSLLKRLIITDLNLIRFYIYNQFKSLDFVSGL